MDLILYRRIEEFLYNIYPRLVKYPKSETHCLCKSIKDTIYNFMKAILKKYTYIQVRENKLKLEGL